MSEGSETTIGDLAQGFLALDEQLTALQIQNKALVEKMKQYQAQSTLYTVPQTTPQQSERISRAREALHTYEKSIKAQSDTSKSITCSKNRPPITRSSSNICALPSIIEQDFTTYGKQGKLECPFSKRLSAAKSSGPPSARSSAFRGRARRPSGSIRTRALSVDPIAAEFHASEMESVVGSAPRDTAPKCPIRFLDQHSPEEVAKYFETHKHELPQSHETCVLRFASDEAGTKELDAKYTDLVSMIKDLGVKHQPMLPSDQEVDDANAADQGSFENIEKWADNVSHSQDQEHDKEGDDARGRPADEDPEASKPLRDIRLGESPSRPWGIPMPADLDDDLESKSAAAVQLPPSMLPIEEKKETAPRGCPFSGKKLAAAATPMPQPKPVAEPVENTKKSLMDAMNVSPNERDEPSTSPSPSPQIVFSGPVFFGWSPEDAAAFLKHLPTQSTKQ